MLVLGLSGGADLAYDYRDFLFPYGVWHDSAAVLLDNGKVVAATEEERLNRIKHTNKAPVLAIKFCLDSYGVCLKDIDKVAMYGDEQVITPAVRKAYFGRIEEEIKGPRDIMHEMFAKGLGCDIADDKLVFVPHHMAHAMSAYAQSGFDRSLVLAIDNSGDYIAGLILSANGNRFDKLDVIPLQKSLGMFYLDVIRFLGFTFFEEYKVMGLAPYGDASKHRALFKSFYTLLPKGDYALNRNYADLLFSAGPRRRRTDPLTQDHKDLAAALQEALEEIVFHVLKHYQVVTGHTNLCLTGGVAHNCTMNGKILYSGMFQNVFVHPAAHDAGCALGAALHVHNESNSDAGRSPVKAPKLQHIYWGTNVPDHEHTLDALSRWRAFIEFEYDGNISKRTAQLLASGFIVGWAQGRSEFGPRALGNRSIVADPRPVENKDIINRMVKKRESFRPFAPAVLEECVSEFFDLPHNTRQFPFMTFVVKVKADKQALLGATTHVDGTARIQTVSKETNSRFWELIDEFRMRTGVPVLLNTSFNNNAEPIVDSVEDAVICFLTTDLHFLVVGDFLIRKKAISHASYLDLIPSLPLHIKLSQTKKFVSNREMTTLFELSNPCASRQDIQISAEVFDLLLHAERGLTLRALLTTLGTSYQQKLETIVEELIQLWSQRAVALRPSLNTGDES